MAYYNQNEVINRNAILTTRIANLYYDELNNVEYEDLSQQARIIVDGLHGTIVFTMEYQDWLNQNEIFYVFSKLNDESVIYKKFIRQLETAFDVVNESAYFEVEFLEADLKKILSFSRDIPRRPRPLPVLGQDVLSILYQPPAPTAPAQRPRPPPLHLLPETQPH
jgi:hypothetical protein